MPLILWAGFVTVLLAGPLAAQETATHRIGLLGPLSGDYVEYGSSMMTGVREAVSEINANGGLLGKQLELIVIDEPCDRAKAIAAAKRLRRDGAVAAFGHFCSGAAIPASPHYAKAGIFMISSSATNPRLTENGHETVFRTVSTDKVQAKIAADYVAREQVGKRIAVAESDGLGELLVDTFRDRLEEQGGSIELYRHVTAEPRFDESAFARRIAEDKIDVLYFGGFHREVASALKAFAELGYRPLIIGADSLKTELLWKDAGPATDGLLMTAYSDWQRIAARPEVISRLQSKGIDPGDYTLYAYASVEVWAEGARRAGTTDAKAVAAAVRAQPVATVIGPLSFDDKGDVIADLYDLWRWHDGDWTSYWYLEN